jgi:hypothetical protein
MQLQGEMLANHYTHKGQRHKNGRDKQTNILYFSYEQSILNIQQNFEKFVVG